MFDLRFFQEQKKKEELSLELARINQEVNGRPKNRKTHKKKINTELDELIMKLL